MPIQLEESEYTGKPLFWFRGDTVPYKSLTPKMRSHHLAAYEERPPRPLIRLLGAPIRQMRQKLSSTNHNNTNQPFLEPEERNDSFETTITVADSIVEDDCCFSGLDTTMVDYSDDEDDCYEDGDDDLYGLCFLEEERE